MSYQTPDCIQFNHATGVDPKFLVVNGNNFPFRLLATQDLKLEAATTSSPDHHEVSFYVVDTSSNTNAAMGFNKDDGMVLNYRLELDGVPLQASADIVVRHAGSSATIDLIALANRTLKFTYNQGGVGGAASALGWKAGATTGLQFDSASEASFAGNVAISGSNQIANFTAAGLRIPLRAAPPAAPQPGEVYYHSGENRLYAYFSNHWWRTDVFG